jgi:isoamyl acetate esterase
MPNFGDYWTGTDCHHPKTAAVIKDFMSTLSFQSLVDHANSIRGRADCRIDAHRFQCGKDHVIFAMHFTGDGAIWIARISLPPGAIEFNISFEEMKSEIATIRFIRANSTIPVPDVYGYNLEQDNQFGAPYVFLQALPGRILKPLPLLEDEIRPRVYQQVASIIVQISQLPPWSQIGLIQDTPTSSTSRFTISNMSLPIPNLANLPAPSSAHSYFDIAMDKFSERKREEGNLDKIAVACLYRKAIPRFLSPELFNCPEFPLCHADFSNCNLLFDDDYNITGVIDWTWAQSRPWELLACFPHELSVKQWPTMSLYKESRSLFLEKLEEEEKQRDPDIPLTRYMGSVAGRILELVQDYQAIMDSDWIPTENIHELVELLYHGTVSWEDIKRMAWVDLGVSGTLKE